MLNKIKENQYQFQVNVRESFTYELDFENSRIYIVYFCKTDNYRFLTSYEFSQFGQNYNNVQPNDFQDIAKLIHSSVELYLSKNIISGSTRRAFLNFENELTSAYTNIGLAQMLIL